MKAMILLSLATGFTFSGAYSQEQFRLSDYVNPEYRWQKLDINFGLGGANNFDRHKIENRLERQHLNSQLNGGLDAYYYSSKNSASYQGFQSVGLSTDLLSDWLAFENLEMEEYNYHTKSHNQQIQLIVSTVNRFYLKKQWFLETDLELSSNFSHSGIKISKEHEFFPYSDESDSRQYGISGALPVMAGIGRIEEVQDARLAVYILDDLSASGDLTRHASSEEILAFAEFITQIKNQRYFDYRLRKIAEITALDSFLAASGLKAQSDASYYTLINDNWDNSNGPVRSTGSRVSAGFVPIIGISNYDHKSYWNDTVVPAGGLYNYENKSEFRSFMRGLDFVTTWIWEKPANLYWQHTVEAGAAYSIYNADEESRDYYKDTLTFEQKIMTDSSNAKINLGYKIGYYPNSRTQITLRIKTNYKQFSRNTINGDYKFDIGNILVENDIVLTCYYYLSPQLRLTVNIGSIYTYTKQNQEQPEDETGDYLVHDFRNYISAGFRYSIF